MKTTLRVPAGTWSGTERSAWAVPVEMRPSEWAEKHRRLRHANIPGPFRVWNAPYLRGIMDIADKPGVVQVNVIKAGQMGVSEAMRTLLAYWAATDPDPVGLGLPNERKGRQIVEDRILPLFRDNRTLADLVRSSAQDLKKGHVALTNGWRLFLMWSGSASSMASDPMRRVVCDEVDKFVPWVGEESDPVSLTLQRMATYEGRQIQINISTPTNRFGKIASLVEEDDMVLDFLCPCPHCGTFQRLLWPHLKHERPDKLKKDAKALAKWVVRNRAVWYECAKCGKRILPDQRDAMVRAGRWGTADEESGLPTPECPDAGAVEAWPQGTRLAVRLNRLVCLWTPWWTIAAEFIRSEGRLEPMMTFYTQTLGQPFEQQVATARADQFSRLSASAPLEEGTAPPWTAAVIVSIDTQADHFYAVARAWGPGMRSARVWHGLVEDFDGLDALLASTWRADGGPPLATAFAIIDSGGTQGEGDRASRPAEVYHFVLSRGSRIRAVKGAARPRPAGQWYWRTKGILDETGGARRRKTSVLKPIEVPLWMIEPQHFADELSEMIHAGEREDEARRWFLNRRDDPDYNHHLAAMHKVVIRKPGGHAWHWQPKTAGMRHDYWDCEVYQVAAAYMARIHLLPGLDDFLAARRADTEAARAAAKAPKPRRDPWKPTPFKV